MKHITITTESEAGTTTQTKQVSDAYADHFARFVDFRAALVSAISEAEEIEADNLRNPRILNMEQVIAAKVRQIAIVQLLDGFDGADIEDNAAAAQ